ncbi:FAD/FMN-containing dehydrogenase [Streptomyces olivoverticillatus]|uniref:FAD/FMN-containing dehydrogenase n=1 Tax=Streptomyces olivoverticillatus TaxID=66427 RepID=A0A7W7LQL0_9ACTN|nr:FAD-binding oxidoreductase [Streptomyces olivoverticillatus]MBB4893956.1 FAD/FMN-containing dehydrogenase [Streptomyces olivoverticillatus]
MRDNRYSRRRFLASTAAAGTTVTVLGTAATLPGVSPAAAAGAAESGTDSTTSAAFGPVTVKPADRRYSDLVWGTNRRWVGTPDSVRLVGSAEQVVAAVQEAVSAGKQIAVRSGGHCYEDFVTSDDVRIVIDMSCMDKVSYDPGRRAFAIEPGARLGDVYRRLYKGWGVTIPGGTCPTVGAGGHIVGGGYGALSRLHGLTVDHLYGIELVVVDKSGTAKKITATREDSDPNRELLWAHTGAGGGNFGVITKYWMRTPGALGTDPGKLLPQPPSEVIVSTVTWSWDKMTEAAFSTVLRNYGQWCQDNSAADSPYAGLFSQLKPTHKSAGSFSMTTQIDAAAPDASRLLDDFLAAVNKGSGVDYRVDDRRTISWLHAVAYWPGFTAPDTTTRFKAKSAYMRKGFPDAQLKAFYKHLTRDDFDGPASIVMITSYGGKINTVAPGDTAVPQRDSVIKLHYISFWQNASDDDRHLSWIREFYQEVYAATGGVPKPGDVNDGCFINYADGDLNSSQWNGSGVPWYELYFKGGYRRLQTVKAQWDPKNVFRHAQSIQLP